MPEQMPGNAARKRRAPGMQPPERRKKKKGVYFDDDDLGLDGLPVPEAKKEFDWGALLSAGPGDGLEEEAAPPVAALDDGLAMDPSSQLMEEPEAPAPGIHRKLERRAPGSPPPERRKRYKYSVDKDDLPEDPKLARQREFEEAEQRLQRKVFEATGVDYDEFMRGAGAQDAVADTARDAMSPDMPELTSEEAVLEQAAPEASARAELPGFADRLAPRLIYRQEHLLQGKPQLGRREQKKLDKADKAYSKGKMYEQYGDQVLDRKGLYERAATAKGDLQESFRMESGVSEQDVDHRNVSALLKSSRRFKKDAKRRAKRAERYNAGGEEKLSRPKMEQWGDLSRDEQMLWGDDVGDRVDYRDELDAAAVPDFGINVARFNNLTNIEDLIHYKEGAAGSMAARKKHFQGRYNDREAARRIREINNLKKKWQG